MVSKELKKLNRRELVDIIYQLKKNEQRLQAENDALRAELEEKQRRLSEVESVTEAAMTITSVLSAARESADLYLKEIASIKADTEMECKKIIQEARNAASVLQPETEKPSVFAQRNPSDSLRRVSQLLRRRTR